MRKLAQVSYLRRGGLLIFIFVWSISQLHP